MRENYQQFKLNFKEGMETSQNPAVQLIAVATDKAKMESSCARAVKQAYDPYFYFNDLEIGAKDIFQEFYCNFLAGNLEFLEKVTEGVALAIFVNIK